MPRPLPGHMALKDFRTRKQVAANELLRKAYLYLYRNTTVDPKIRTQAMLELNAFTKDTRPTSVKNRCTETGRGGGVLSEFGLCRHRFKLAAEKGDIPGVSRAAW